MRRQYFSLLASKEASLDAQSSIAKCLYFLASKNANSISNSTNYTNLFPNKFVKKLVARFHMFLIFSKPRGKNPFASSSLLICDTSTVLRTAKICNVQTLWCWTIIIFRKNLTNLTKDVQTRRWRKIEKDWLLRVQQVIPVLFLFYLFTYYFFFLQQSHVTQATGPLLVTDILLVADYRKWSLGQFARSRVIEATG